MASDKFVSRGGEKLQAAIAQWGPSFQLSIVNLICLDVGSSTGGFVDCLLQNKAKKVYALDTAYGELAWKLRNDPRVAVMERTNILRLQSLPEEMDLVTIDAGWTKLELVLPVIKSFLKEDGVIIALLKPHYEAEKKDLVKGILPPEKAEQVKDQVLEKIVNFQLSIVNCMDSPILGGAGNKEYLLFLRNKSG